MSCIPRAERNLGFTSKFGRTVSDDWGLAPLSEENRRDLLEIIEDRHDGRATLVTSQVPVEHWHEALEH